MYEGSVTSMQPAGISTLKFCTVKYLMLLGSLSLWETISLMMSASEHGEAATGLFSTFSKTWTLWRYKYNDGRSMEVRIWGWRASRCVPRRWKWSWKKRVGERWFGLRLLPFDWHIDPQLGCYGTLGCHEIPLPSPSTVMAPVLMQGDKHAICSSPCLSGKGQRTRILWTRGTVWQSWAGCSEQCSLQWVDRQMQSHAFQRGLPPSSLHAVWAGGRGCGNRWLWTLIWESREE